MLVCHVQAVAWHSDVTSPDLAATPAATQAEGIAEAKAYPEPTLAQPEKSAGSHADLFTWNLDPPEAQVRPSHINSACEALTC